MTRDDFVDVWHTAVTKFQSISVKYFVERIFWGEAIINSLKEFTADVGSNISIIRGIKPGYISISRSLRSWLLGVIFKFIVVSTSI